MVFAKLFAHLIDGFFIVGTGLSLIGTRLKLRLIIIIGAIFALAIYTVRTLYNFYEIPFGTHSFILVMILIFLLKTLGKQDTLNSVVASLLSFLLILWQEGFFQLPLLKFLKLDPLVLASNPGGFILLVIISDMLLIMGFLIGYVFKIPMVNLNKLKKTEQV